MIPIWIVGLVTILVTPIGMWGIHRTQKALNEKDIHIKVKETIGQEVVLVFFYFNLLLIGAHLLVGSGCLFYQEETSNTL
jgi:hypothetical protein